MKILRRFAHRLKQALPMAGAKTHPLVPAHHGVDAVSMARDLTEQGFYYCLHHLGQSSKETGPIVLNTANVSEVLEFLDDENQDLCISLCPDQIGYERNEKTGSNKALKIARNFRNRVQAREVEGRQVERAQQLSGATEDQDNEFSGLAENMPQRPLLSIHAAPKVPMQHVLALSARLARAGVPVCQTIPAALQRSLDDAKVLISQGHHVRLSFDPVEVIDAKAFHDPDLIEDNYTAIAALLLSEDALIQQIRPIFALQTDDMADHILKLADLHGWSAQDFEFEIPYGINRDLKHRLRDDGYRVRILLPFGKEWGRYVENTEK